MNMVHIGFGNAVSVGRIVAIAKPNTAPIKRMISKAESDGVLIDATFGRKNRSVIFMDSGHIVLSAIQPDRITERCEKEPDNRKNSRSENEEENEEENELDCEKGNRGYQ